MRPSSAVFPNICAHGPISALNIITDSYILAHANIANQITDIQNLKIRISEMIVDGYLNLSDSWVRDTS
jgi:hypothetical protein